MANAYVPAESSSRFFVPRTLASDFTNFLQNDIPGAVGDFTVIADWVNKEDIRIVRGEIYPDSTKSRYSNTDNNLNFRSDVNSGIKKGDIIVFADNNETYLLDWEVPPQPNNRMSRALRCNAYVEFKRFVPEEVDRNGYLIQEEGWQTIVDSTPCNAYRHDGRLEFSVNSALPGLIPNALTLLFIQYNSQTKNIRVDDVFEWGNEQYVVADVNFVGVNMTGESGIIQLQAKKKAGGSK